MTSIGSRHTLPPLALARAVVSSALATVMYVVHAEGLGSPAISALRRRRLAADLEQRVVAGLLAHVGGGPAEQLPEELDRSPKDWWRTRPPSSASPVRTW